MTPREVLNELKWRDRALARARVTYRHRGAPHDERTIEGNDIAELGRSFFELRSTRPFSSSIPYHRVLRIEVDGALVWERRESGP